MRSPRAEKQHRIVDAAITALTILGGEASVEAIYSVIKRHGLYRFNTPVELHVLAQTIKRHAVNSRRSDSNRYQKIFVSSDATWGSGAQVSLCSSYVHSVKPDHEDVSSGAEIDSAINPQHALGGIRVSSEERKAVELRAMLLADGWLRAHGFTDIKDCSANHPFDYLATRDGRTWKVEVKGTSAPSADAFLMTSNEVALHESERGSTVLIIVYSISLTRKSKQVSASRGVVCAHVGWDISTWLLEPKAYRVTRT